MKRVFIILFLMVLSGMPIFALAESFTIVHSCNTYGEVLPCS